MIATIAMAAAEIIAKEASPEKQPAGSLSATTRNSKLQIVARLSGAKQPMQNVGNEMDVLFEERRSKWESTIVLVVEELCGVFQ